MSNQWRKVPSFPSYEVDRRGRVRRAVAQRGTRKGKVLRPYARPDGYLVVHLSEDRIHSVQRVHRLVTEAFLGPCPDGKQVNHKNGRRDDNRLENLEYVTPGENNLHAYRVLGRTRLVGESHGRAKLTRAHVRQIRRERDRGVTLRELAGRFGVAESTISRAHHATNWSHIG